MAHKVDGQAVSLNPQLKTLHSNLTGYPEGYLFPYPEEAAGAATWLGPVTVVGYDPAHPDGEEHKVIGLTEPDEILTQMQEYAREGLYIRLEVEEEEVQATYVAVQDHAERGATVLLVRASSAENALERVTAEFTGHWVVEGAFPDDAKSIYIIQA